MTYWTKFENIRWVGEETVMFYIQLDGKYYFLANNELIRTAMDEHNINLLTKND